MAFICFDKFLENLGEVELIAQAADGAFFVATQKGSDVPAETSAKARIQGNAMTRAGLVLLCGFLEGFIRDIAEEYVDFLNDEEIELKSFPDELFRSVILDIADGLRSRDANAVTGVRGYIENQQRPQLNKKRFSNTGGNPTVDTIEAIFLALGIPNVIDKLSIEHYLVESTYINESQVQPAMRDAISASLNQLNNNMSDAALSQIVALIESKWLPKKKRRKVGYVNEIEQLLKKRNRIAHGEGSEQVTSTELRKFAQCVGRLGEGLNGLVRLTLDALPVPVH